MVKTKFTFVPTSRLVSGLSFVMALFFGLNLNAQCTPPANVDVFYGCDGAVTLSWNAVPDAQSYTVDIENGAPVVDFVNMVTTTLTIEPGTLTPGTTYQFAITANCGVSDVSSTQGTITGADITNAQPMIAISNVTSPYCPDIDATGEFDVVITDDGCGGTYEVFVDGASVATGVASGDVTTVSGLTAAVGGTEYVVTIEAEAGNTCNYTNSDGGNCLDNVSASTTLTPQDNQGPTAFITSTGGILVEDGAGGGVDAFSYDAPEGECGAQLVWLVGLGDDCFAEVGLTDAEITFTNANAGVNPGPSFVLTQTGFDSYSLELFAAIGENVLTINIEDENGNPTEITKTITVSEQRAPEIAGPVANGGTMTVQIPSCQTEGVPVNFTVVATDDCDLEPALVSNGTINSGDVVGAGTYTASYTATDDSGNTSTYSFTVVVEQVASPAPIVDVSGNDLEYSISACEDEAVTLFSGNVYDCNLAAGGAETVAVTVTPDAGASLTAAVAVSFTDVQDGFLYFEAVGTGFTPGAYSVAYTYGGVTVEQEITVVQDAPQAAVVEIPGNLTFTVPACETQLDATFQVRVSDDCDDPIAAPAITIDGTPVDVIADLGNGLFEVSTVITAANDGDFLVASYTDGDGLTTTVDGVLTVNDQPDTFQPIIVYPSQNINVTLDPCGPSMAEVVFQASAYDNCSDVTPVVTVSGGANVAPAGGSTFIVTAPANGTYTVTIDATDDAGNASSESFDIVVSQDEAPQPSLACNDDINVTLDANCSRVITADMVLEGSFGCLDNGDFVINIVNDADPSNLNILDGYGQFIYEITGPQVTGSNGNVAVIPEQNFTGFTGDFLPVLSPNVGGNALTVALNGSSSIQFTQTADPGIGRQEVSATIAITQSGTATYDWSHSSNEFTGSSFDIFLYSVNGDRTNLSLGTSGATESGTETIDLQAGDILAWVMSVDAVAPNISSATISNFSYVVPEQIIGDDDIYGGFENCWGYITGEDKTDPIISCPANDPADFLCSAFDVLYGGDAGNVAQETAFIEGTYIFTGAPSAVDNCDTDLDFTATDSFTEVECGDIVITRTFTVTDQNGNSDACTQTITLRTPTLDDVNFPDEIVDIDCGTAFAALPSGAPMPSVTGFPFVDDVFTFGPHLLDFDFKNLAASYEDSPLIDVCEGTFKFQREWTVFDWCVPGDTEVFTQFIKVGDATAPALTCPAGTPLVYSTSPFSCAASFQVPMPGVSDNCSSATVYTEIVTTTEEEELNQYGLPTGNIIIDTVVVRQIPANASRFVAGIPFGSHMFRYVATDECGNTSELYCAFEVVDQIEPVAVCDDQLNVSIGGGNIVPGQPALARVFAEDVDEGSWDNCGPVTIAIFRNNFNAAANTCGSGLSATGDFVDFFCCDVGVTSDITLVVTDQYGNQNSCWLSVTPEDKINPFCTAPADITVDCDDLPYGFDATDAAQREELFGMATGADNCGVADIAEISFSADLECGYGSITRVFQVTDVQGLNSQNTCVQVITINEVHNYEIFFPEDADYACGLEEEPDTVSYNELGCDLLAVTSDDEIFSASGDECYKIFRTWKVINWCEYDGEGDPYIVGRDLDCAGNPGIYNVGDGLWLLARENGDIFFDADTNENGGLPGSNACGVSPRYYQLDDSFTAATRPGYYQYTQIIKVYDDIAPEISFTQADPFCSLDNVDCDATVTYPFSIDENCTPEDLTIKVFLNPFNSGNLTQLPASVLSGSYPDYTISGVFPLGNHSFEVHVLDGCGNSDLAILPFSVVDCKAPAPICINGISIELMPVDEDGDNLPDPGAGMAEIWASDFVASPITDCSEPIKYSINRVGEPNNPDQDGLVLTCADLGTLPIEIWAYDAAGNGDFCETFLLVQDNMGVCGEAGPMAAGAVSTEDAESVEDVEVSLSGNGSATVMTDENGSYVFTNLDAGLDYTVTPQRDGDYLNGVSTFDLVLISKHILGVEPLSTPYKRIAADVNSSGSITTLDLIQLRKLILSIDTEFSNNTSWRFVEAGYVFPNPSNPWMEQFPEVININDMPAAGIAGANFVAVKIGDVNGDAQPNSFAGVEERATGTFALNVAEASLTAGNEYSVAVTAAGLANIEGYQATLTLSSAVELVDIVSGVAAEENFGFTYASEGMITTSWNGQAAEGVLFTLVIRATEDAQLSEVLGVSSAITKAEAYGKDGSLQDVAIEFSNGTVAAAGFEVYQNQPNPFKGETVIGFNLPEAASATVTISDITGKVMKLYRIDGVAGYNEVTVNANDLPATGVVSYTVETGDFTATKKMVIIE